MTDAEINAYFERERHRRGLLSKPRSYYDIPIFYGTLNAPFPGTGLRVIGYMPYETVDYDDLLPVWTGYEVAS